MVLNKVRALITGVKEYAVRSSSSDKEPENVWKKQLEEIENELSQTSEEADEKETIVIKTLEYVIKSNEEGLKMLADEEMAEKKRKGETLDKDDLDFEVDKMEI